MKKTPKHNENYFFNDYQEKGEIYNIQNGIFLDGLCYVDL